MRLSIRMILPLGLLAASYAWAAQPDRIVRAINNNQSVVLKGSAHPMAKPQFDQGPVEPSMKLEYMTLQVSPSPSQQAELDKLLAEQQDSASPNYHKWLTPEQFANRFGMSRTDVAKVKNWLSSQGFTIVQVARARNWVAFSGTAAQVQSALHTEIHHFLVDGEQHYANSTDIFLPKALAGVVTSVRGLDDFLWKSMLARRVAAPGDGSDAWKPFYSTGGGNYLAPDDIATIYDIKPLYAAGIDGSNINLVIVGQADVILSDITQFRSGFHLPAIKLQQTLAMGLGCVDPGNTDLVEAELDLEWSGAVARNANIIFVKCDAAHGGVLTSAQYAVDHNLGPVISMSYGLCEPSVSLSNATQIRALVQQANLSGITFMASAGDSGAAACDSGNPPATGGLEVNLPASVPETTALGGSEFIEGGGTYWGSNGPNFGSALSYIPEEGWNDTPLGGGFASTGGGKSIYFSKPSWQTGSDTVRDVPDVTITASADHDGYLLCSSGSCGSGIVNDHFIVGGTSASSPVFAGIVTLLNHYLVKNGGQLGLSNINPTLYRLVQSNPSAFHDITTGNNIVPCTPGTPPSYPPAQRCPAGGQFGYNAGVGYDKVTGLGSVDAYNLITGWNSSAVATTTTLAIAPASPVNFGTSVTLTATVTPAPAVTIPAQVVTFNDTVRGKLGSGTLNSSGVATFTSSTLAAASYSIVAKYGGDSSFAGSSSPTPSTPNLVVQNFQIAASPSTLTVSAPGQTSGSTTITVTPQLGFSQAVTFSCTAGLPSEATCVFNPTSVTPSGGSAATTTLTIQTMAPSARLLRHSRGIFYALLLPGLLGLAVSAGNRKQTVRGMRLLGLIGVLALSALWMPACGGSGGSGTQGNPGTPPGTSSVTVTAATGGANPLSNSVPGGVTLTVQ